MAVIVSRNPAGILAALRDTFQRADSTTLSTGAPYTWSEISNDLEIKTNLLHPVTTNAVDVARIETDLGVDDNWSEGVVNVTKHATLETTATVCARQSSSAVTSYNAWLIRTGGVETFKLQKLVAAAGTNLTSVNQAWATGDRVTCQVKGSIIRGLLNGAEISRVVDTSIATGQRIAAGFFLAPAGGDINLSEFLGGPYNNVPVFSNLTNAGSATDATSYATASVTPASGTLVLISFTHGFASALPKDADSVTGTSISGAVKIATTAYNSVATPRTKTELWAAIGTGSAGVITIQFGSGTSQTETGASWSVDQVTNINTGLGTNGVIQSVTSAAAASTSLVTGTLATFQQADNPAFACFGQALNSAITQEAGWVELADVGHITPTEQIETSYTAWADTAHTATATSGVYGTVICELAAKTTGGSVPLVGLSQAGAQQAATF